MRGLGQEVRTQLLQGGHAIGLIVVLLDLGPAALHLLAGHRAHRLLGQLHAADDGLKALVGKGRLLPVQLNNPGNPKAPQTSVTHKTLHLRSLPTQKRAQTSKAWRVAFLIRSWVPLLSGKEGTRGATSPFYREGI